VSGVKDRLTDAGYGLGWSVVCRLPESWAQRGFRFAADLAWRRQRTGVQVLEGDLRKVIGGEASGGELRALSREAVRSYARYWLEVFRLPVMPVDRLVGGMRDTGHIRTAFEYLAAGREVVFAPPHGQLGPGWRMDHRQRGRLPYRRDRAGEAGVGLRQVRRVPRGTRPGHEEGIGPVHLTAQNGDLMPERENLDPPGLMTATSRTRNWKKRPRMR
jgi:Bacterial lipid A biosynthesis acyltransferase